MADSQASSATPEKRTAGARNFAEIAVERGYCTAADLKQAALEHRSLQSADDLSKFLVKRGVLSEEQAKACERAARGATVIAGFELLEKVGQGGMGAVFRARQLSMDRIVAMKILPRRLAEDPSFKQRFIQEAKLSAKLSHMNIIAGIDCGEQGGYTYFAMEFVDGKTVKDMLEQNGKFPPADAFDIIRQMAEALVYAQSRNLVHRDIKPDNIMVTSAGVAKLCDLGLAKQTHVPDDANMTQAGQAVGTPHFISPEQARGEKQVDTRSDIYSLGGTWYNMLAGRTPFDAPTGASVMALHITDSAANPCDLDPAIPLGYGEIISKMMAKSAADRYVNAQELLEDLDAAKAKAPLKASLFHAKSSCAFPKRSRHAAAPGTGERRAIQPRTGLHRRTTSPGQIVVIGLLGLCLCGGLGFLYYDQRIRPHSNAVSQNTPPDTTSKAGETKEAKSVTPAKVIETPKVDEPKKAAVPAKADTKPKPVPEPKKVMPEVVPGVLPADVAVSKPLPPTPPELPAIKLDTTSDMLYARFLTELAKITAKGDLPKALSELRDLSAKPEFAPAKADINGELADVAEAIAYEQGALKNKAGAGGELELNEETAKKWGTSKGTIIGYEPGKGIMVKIGSNMQLPIPAAAVPLAEILKNAADKSGLARARYLSARGNFKDAFAALGDAKEGEKARMKRKLELAQRGETELQAQAAVANLQKVAEAKSWKTFTAMMAEFDAEFGKTVAAADAVLTLHDWKIAAKNALAPLEGLEASGKFSPVKAAVVNPCAVTVKTDPETRNKTLMITAEAAVSEPPPKKDVDTKASADEPKKDEMKKPPAVTREKVAVQRLGAEALNLTAKSAVTFRARHAGTTPLPVAVGFMVGEKYYETPQVAVPPNEWSENAIRIDGPFFKVGAADPPKYDSEIVTRAAVPTLYIVAYTREALSLEIDAIFLKSASAEDAPKIPVAPTAEPKKVAVPAEATKPAPEPPPPPKPAVENPPPNKPEPPPPPPKKAGADVEE
ncbi:MAG TPA: serine/threonine-protein kinase [Planctomycetota bacterium]|jgi:serine/threonine-protein kinase